MYSRSNMHHSVKNVTDVTQNPAHCHETFTATPNSTHPRPTPRDTFKPTDRPTYDNATLQKHQNIHKVAETLTDAQKK